MRPTIITQILDHKYVFFKKTDYYIILAFVVLAIKGFLLGSYPLMDETEARYAEISREMVVLNDWITPRIDPQTPFWGKPPLSFWLTAASYKIFGVSELSARLPSYMLSIGTLFLVAILAFSFFGKKISEKSILILSTSLLFYGHAGFVSTDNAFGFSITLALFSFLFFCKAEIGRSNSKWIVLFAVSAAFSVLAKGLLGIVFVGGPIFFSFVINRKIRNSIGFREAAIALMTFCLIAIPWHLIAEGNTPGFLRYYFLGEHISRFLDKGWQGDLYGKAHSQPFGMIWLYFAISIFPWGIPLLTKLFRTRTEKLKLSFKKMADSPAEVLLFFWMIIPLIFFTFAGNILVTYVYPSLIPFSILVSKVVFNEAPDNSSASNKLIYLALIVPSIFISLVYFVLPVLGDSRSQKLLVEAYKSQRFMLGSNLVYLDTKPFSADFYLGENALQMTQSIDHKLDKHFKDGELGCYVLKTNNLVKYSPYISHTKKVMTIGRYSLFCDSTDNYSRVTSTSFN